METKTCSLTENEILELMNYHGRNMMINTEDRVERIAYLNRRLKAEKKDKPENQPKAQMSPEETKATTSW